VVDERKNKTMTMKISVRNDMVVDSPESAGKHLRITRGTELVRMLAPGEEAEFHVWTNGSVSLEEVFVFTVNGKSYFSNKSSIHVSDILDMCGAAEGTRLRVTMEPPMEPTTLQYVPGKHYITC
jgi:hypothetical protein